MSARGRNVLQGCRVPVTMRGPCGRSYLRSDRPYPLGAVRYLITGGAGFIGSHLAEALLARGDDVVALDNMATGNPRNLEALDGQAAFRLVEGSILDGDVVDALVADCDTVLHLAAAAGVKLVVADPVRALRTNIDGTEIVLEAVRRHGKKVFFSSSSEIYGKQAGTMHEEADRVLGPTTIARWAFSTSKAVDEILALGFAREEVPTIIARFFNTVGPRQNGAYGYVVPTFVAQALLGTDITIYGDGNQTRCFCDVEDTVRAVLGLVDGEGFTGNIYNIGSSDEISINDLAQRVLEETGSSSTIRHIAYENAYGDGYEDMPRRVPDTSKIRDAIGWAPRHELGAIIKRTIDHAIEVGPEKLLGD